VTADTVIDGEGDTQGWNRFSYVHNNPIRYKDPTGHFKDESTHKITTDSKGDMHRSNVHQGTVEKGDTLNKIAQKNLEYQLGGKEKLTSKAISNKVNEIKTLNGLKNDTIQPGQSLKIGTSDINMSKRAGMNESSTGALKVPVADNVVVGVAGAALVKGGILGASRLYAAANTKILETMAEFQALKTTYDKCQPVKEALNSIEQNAKTAATYLKGVAQGYTPSSPEIGTKASESYGRATGLLGPMVLDNITKAVKDNIREK
jgi:LysM repeat protein